MINLREIIGFGVMLIGLVFMVFGTLSLFRFKHFYSRILQTSLIDTSGLMTMIIGMVIYQGWSFFTLKLGSLLFIILLLNPVATHFITKSAYLSGYHIKKGD